MNSYRETWDLKDLLVIRYFRGNGWFNVRVEAQSCLGICLFRFAHDKSSLTQVVKVFVCFECLCAAQKEGRPFSSRDNALKALESNRPRDSLEMTQLEKGDIFWQLVECLSVASVNFLLLLINFTVCRQYFYDKQFFNDEFRNFER